MTERVEDTTISTESGAQPDIGAGARLKQAREAAGMHVGALAVMLKVPVHRLEALESERWDLLPDAVFVRALAGSVCRALKVDAAPVLEKLPNPARQPVAPDDGLNAPFRGAQGQGPVTLAASQLSRPLVLAVLALLLGAVVLVFLPWFQRLASPTPVGSDRTAALSAPMATVDKAASMSVEPVPTLAKGPESVAASATGAAAVLPASAPVVTASSVLAGAPSTPGEAGRPIDQSRKTASENIIVFSVRGPSWIQVTDAKGATILKKELSPGEIAGASGVLPLSVVVGRVDVTTVEVRGKLMDLAALAQNNVARFEVKE